MENDRFLEADGSQTLEERVGFIFRIMSEENVCDESVKTKTYFTVRGEECQIAAIFVSFGEDLFRLFVFICH